MILFYILTNIQAKNTGTRDQGIIIILTKSRLRDVEECVKLGFPLLETDMAPTLVQATLIPLQSSLSPRK